MKRKKWTEEEEKSLIKKYGEMISNGSLYKMKTREKKYKPIALYLNAVHHAFDPFSYPCQWTWKDVSTKVQNMRHQYLLVKQKIKKTEIPTKESSDAGGSSNMNEFDWAEGLVYWSNFLRYRKVFGDFLGGGAGCNLIMHANDDKENKDEHLSCRETDVLLCDHIDNGTADFGGIDVCSGGVMGDLSFDFEGDEGTKCCSEEPILNTKIDQKNEESFSFAVVPRKKDKRLRIQERMSDTFLLDQLQKLKDIEAEFEKSEADGEHERKDGEKTWLEQGRDWDKKLEEIKRRIGEKEMGGEQLRQQRLLEWKSRQKEIEERERKQVEDELTREREWQERMNTRRIEWRKRVEGMLNQHRAALIQAQNRILNEQQTMISQYLDMFSHWTGHLNLMDHLASNNECLSQVMHSLHHLNGVAREDAPLDRDSQDSHFIVD